jgi:ClpP class serine protease
MSPFAVLGPIDPQLGNYPAPSLVKLRNEKDINKIDDNTLILADLAQKAIDQLRESVEELLSENYGPEKAKELGALLTEGRWTHDYPITADYAKTLGLNVSTTIPDEFLALMSMYPQPTRTRPNVEYLERGNEK